MRENNENVREVLGQELEVSPLVENRIQETYTQLLTNKKSTYKSFKGITKVAAAAAVAMALCGTTALGVYASGSAGFLESIFGTQSRSSKPAKTIQIEDEKGGTLEVTYPANEYVAMDADTYKNIQPYIMNIEKTFTIADHKITVLNHITDGNTGVVSYKMECSKGVTMLNADEEKNRTKGADISEQSKGYFYLEGANGETVADKIYIDTEKSTDTCYYLYQSYVCDGNGGAEKIRVEEYNQTYQESEKTNTKLEVVDNKMIDIKADQTVKDKKVLKDGENTICEISSLGLSLDLKYLDQFKEEAKDTVIDIYQVKNVVINYTDGSSYVVYDSNKNIDNTNYLCGSMGDSENVERIAFNRVIDPSRIKNITINNEIKTL